MTKTISLSELETKAITLLAEKPRLILALDGPCASGKTTLAHMLQQNLGWTVFHMDDFFLRPEQRTKERYTVPGGNVDHERFLDEVLLPMSMGDPVYLRPFDCKTMDFRKTQTVKPCAVTLVEGAYSCHPSLWDFYDLHLFLEIDPEEQNRRILQSGTVRNRRRCFGSGGFPWSRHILPPIIFRSDATIC